MESIQEIVKQAKTAFMSNEILVLVFETEKTLNFEDGPDTGKALQLPHKGKFNTRSSSGDEKFIEKSGSMVSPDHYQNNPDYDKVDNPKIKHYGAWKL